MDPDWPAALHDLLASFSVGLVAHVPDAGHARLIRLAGDDPAIRVVTLTTEEEGIPLLAGAHLGGQNGCLLMQSSGVGNCINMLSLAKTCRFPVPMLVTMRGEWGERNPWQVPMGQATPTVLEAMGVLVLRADRPEDVADAGRAALTMAFEGPGAAALLLGQRLIGAKAFAAPPGENAR